MDKAVAKLATRHAHMRDVEDRAAGRDVRGAGSISKAEKVKIFTEVNQPLTTFRRNSGLNGDAKHLFENVCFRQIGKSCVSYL